MFIINMIQHHWSGHLTQKIHDNAMTKFSWLLMFQCARLVVLFLHLCLQIQLGATQPTSESTTQLALGLYDFVERQTPTVKQNDASGFAHELQVYIVCKVPMGCGNHSVLWLLWLGGKPSEHGSGYYIWIETIPTSSPDSILYLSIYHLWIHS